MSYVRRSIPAEKAPGMEAPAPLMSAPRRWMQRAWVPRLQRPLWSTLGVTPRRTVISSDRICHLVIGYRTYPSAASRRRARTARYSPRSPVGTARPVSSSHPGNPGDPSLPSTTLASVTGQCHPNHSTPTGRAPAGVPLHSACF